MKTYEVTESFPAPWAPIEAPRSKGPSVFYQQGQMIPAGERLSLDEPQARELGARVKGTEPTKRSKDSES